MQPPLPLQFWVLLHRDPPASPQRRVPFGSQTYVPGTHCRRDGLSSQRPPPMQGVMHRPPWQTLPPPHWVPLPQPLSAQSVWPSQSSSCPLPQFSAGSAFCAKHRPLQRRWPVGQVLLHGTPSAMHWSLHLRPLVQSKSQRPLLQTARALPGAGHRVQAAPHASASVLDRQAPLHRCEPSLQRIPQAPLVQIAVPFAVPGQGEQELPQDMALLSGRHSLPHLWKPLRHLKPQAPASQVASAFIGVGQGWHELPQLLTAVLGWQKPLQSCVPDGQVPSQDAPTGRHLRLVLHKAVPCGQVGWHMPLVQVTPPPSAGAQGVHDCPHDSG